MSQNEPKMAKYRKCDDVMKSPILKAFRDIVTGFAPTPTESMNDNEHGFSKEEIEELARQAVNEYEHGRGAPPEDARKVDIAEVVGQGYRDFWNYKGRYRVVKGSRGSKKSYTTALWYIVYMMGLNGANLVVIRRYMNTHFQSTRATLVWAIQRLGVEHLWNIPKRDHTLTYRPTGQCILFRGMDDPQSITSITVSRGYLCWAWFEEAFQIENESDFNMVDLSIRGKLPSHLFNQLTFTFNPWSSKSWLKRRFFDRKKDSILAITTSYMINEFLSRDDITIFEDMKKEQPRRYQIEGLGNWGIAEGLVFENWKVVDFDYTTIIKRSLQIDGTTHLKVRFGLDFGYTNDPSALIAVIVDEKKRKMYIFDEFYEKGKTNMDLAKVIKERGYDREVITCDSAEPKSIEELRRFGIRNAKGARKGRDSIMNGISKLQDYKLYVHPRCAHTQEELSNYVYETKKNTDKPINKPIDDFNHLMDALRYATEDIHKQQFRWMGKNTII